MEIKNYKSIDDLMLHLQDNGIAISSDTQRQQLMTTGYFHGYKGYRFFKIPSKQIPFKSFDEIYATIVYDSKLKNLLYGKVMFLETALKNIALNTIMSEIGSSSPSVMYEKAIASYKNAPNGTPENKKKEYQQKKLNLQGTIHHAIMAAYIKDNPKITHFYNSVDHNEVPLWAIFEILTMGNFVYLLSALTMTIRDKISRELGLNLSCDTNRELLYKYVYLLKDLRNSIAHNNVVYDTRFRKSSPTRSMKQCLIQETGLPYINFDSIDDYIILICYFLKLLKIPKEEIISFINGFEVITKEYQNSVSKDVSAITIQPDIISRLDDIKKSYKA